MFVLIQKSRIDDHKKYLVSSSYDEIIKYIYLFDDIKKLDDYHYRNNYLYFVIKLSEVI